MKHKFITSIVLLLCAAAPAVSASDAPTGKPSKVEEVIVVFKTHFDIGYTDMGSNVVQTYRTTMIDQALAVVDEATSQT